MVEKDKKYIIDIEAISSDGNGIAHVDGFTIFVPGAAAGDVSEVVITKVKPRFAYGKITRLITPSRDRVNPICQIYENCGGCQLQHISYEAELREKKNIIENAMKRIGGFGAFRITDIIGMDNPVRYRNKAIFPVGYVKGKAVCGFYAMKSHDIIPLDDCMIGDELNRDINNAVIKYMTENNVSAYDEVTHSGVIRRVFTRKSFSTGDMMVVISANAKKLPQSENLVEKLKGVSDRIKSVILNINTKRNNFLITEENVTLWGLDRIEDTLCGIKFEISPQSFFQINPIQTEKLYSKVMELADIDKTMSVMDIYCGIGTISLCAAKQAGKVIGIEIVERAIDDAKKNAENNGIDNAEFFADSAENIVPKLINQGERPDVVILDPPRKGSDEATLSAVVTAQPKRIVYVSCNPATLARDAAYLAKKGYEINDAYGFDLFPKTMHVESIVLMSRDDK